MSKGGDQSESEIAHLYLAEHNVWRGEGEAVAGFGVVRSRSNISSASKWPPPILLQPSFASTLKLHNNPVGSEFLSHATKVNADIEML